MRYVNAERQLLVGLLLFTDGVEEERGSVVGRASLGSELWLEGCVGFIASRRIVQSIKTTRKGIIEDVTYSVGLKTFACRTTLGNSVTIDQPKFAKSED